MGGGGLAGGSGEAPLDASGSHGSELDTGGEAFIFRKLASFDDFVKSQKNHFLLKAEYYHKFYMSLFCLI